MSWPKPKHSPHRYDGRARALSGVFDIFSRGAGKGNRTPDSTLGRSRFTTKPYPLIVAAAVYVFVTAVAMIPRVVTATEATPVHFDAGLVEWGKTLTLPDGAKVGIFPHVLPNEADVTWTISEAAVPTLPDNTEVVGSVYRLTVDGISSFTAGVKPVAVVLPPGSSSYSRRVWMYDIAGQKWTALSTASRSSGNFQVTTTSLNAYYAVLASKNTQTGIASWYCKNYCSKKYPTLHGTSNDFPIGSYVTVKSTETQRSVKVKIISTWGQPKGRVIDLSWAAYSALKTKNKGVTPVVVTAVPTTTANTSSATLSAESLPSLTLTKANDGAAPKISAAAYAVYDQTTGTMLTTKNGDTKRPVASLTKLVTAMVALDANVSMDKVMTYSRVDVTPYAYLRVSLGDQLTVKDAFYSLLVGSANNAATVLARSTGMSTSQFVDKMNEKVASWGLANTHFTGVSGLNVDNVSTASDMAIIAAHAFHDYPLIKHATLQRAYSFTTRNTKRAHTIKSTDTLLLKGSSLAISGAKTGYLDEAQYTYVLRTTNSQGAQVISVVLGSPTSTLRFTDAALLAHWAWDHYSWS